MRHSNIVTFILFSLLLGVASGDVQAAGGLECVKTQCEGKGRACVEALYAKFDACFKAANKKCDAVPLSEKAKCLRSERSPCSLARNKERQACLADVQTCYTSCGPFKGKRTDYWCVGQFGKTTTGFFCAADPAKPTNVDQCEKDMTGSRGPLSDSMDCESL